MKTCFKCGEEKNFSEFYKHSAMGDGYLGKCKDCTKSAVRGNYRKNIDHYKAYEKERAVLPHRVVAREKYASTEKGKERLSAAKKKWLNNLENSIKYVAHNMVNNAVRDGRLIKPKFCSCCGKDSARIEGHHDDYALPLVVRWLCSKCHKAWHKENKPLNF